MRNLLYPCILVAAWALGACGAPPTDDPAPAAEESEAALVERARAIHERVITLDTHDDINTDNFTSRAQLCVWTSPTQVTLPKMEAGGLDVAWFVVYTGTGKPRTTEEGYRGGLRKRDRRSSTRSTGWPSEYAPDRIESGADLRRRAPDSTASGKLVAMIGIENAYPVGLDLDNIRDFAERGGRYMSLAHNGHSQFADSNTGERDGVWLHDGLSDRGKQAVAEMNKWGIMIDLSHPSKASNMQTLELTRAPVIASHSSARALNDVSRNLDDEELAAIKENGGVVQTVAFSSYVDSAKHAAHREAMGSIESEIAAEMGVEMVERQAIMAMSDDERSAYFRQASEVRRRARARVGEVADTAPPVDVSDFVDHLDYLVEKMGLEHVGISSDFDGGGGVHGWNDASETFNVTLELVRRGYTEEQIRDAVEREPPACARRGPASRPGDPVERRLRVE